MWKQKLRFERYILRNKCQDSVIGCKNEIKIKYRSKRDLLLTIFPVTRRFSISEGTRECCTFSWAQRISLTRPSRCREDVQALFWLSQGNHRLLRDDSRRREQYSRSALWVTGSLWMAPCDTLPDSLCAHCPFLSTYYVWSPFRNYLHGCSLPI